MASLRARRWPGIVVIVCVGVMMIAGWRAARIMAAEPPTSPPANAAGATSPTMAASYAAPVALPPVVVAVPVQTAAGAPFNSPFGAALARRPAAMMNAPALIATVQSDTLVSQPGDGAMGNDSPFDGFSAMRSRAMPDDDEMSRRRRLATIRRFNRDFETLPGVWLRGTAEPNIREPGPDSINFPNSAYAVPVGVIYFEGEPFTYRRVDHSPLTTYLSPFLLRVGIFSKVELRIQGSGVTSIVSPHDTFHGFSPLIFGFKHTWWEEVRDSFIPAVGLEMGVQTNLGSPLLSTPEVQPSYSLNFDHSLPFDYVFEWNIGSTYGAQIDGARVTQFNFEYSLQGPIIDNVEAFVHGFINTPATGTRLKDGSMVGAGGVWYVARRLAVYGSYSHGLTPETVRTLIQLGFAVAL